MLSYGRGNRKLLEFIVMPSIVVKRVSSSKLPPEPERLQRHSFSASINFVKLGRIS
jgi:hypothetical protein